MAERGAAVGVLERLIAPHEVDCIHRADKSAPTFARSAFADQKPAQAGFAAVEADLSAGLRHTHRATPHPPGHATPTGLRHTHRLRHTRRIGVCTPDFLAGSHLLRDLIFLYQLPPMVMFFLR